MFKRLTRTARTAGASLALGALLVLAASGSAKAVFLDADTIDAGGGLSTVDLWFFELTANADLTIKVNDLGGPPVVGADPDMVIYFDDGTFSNVKGSDNTGGGADPVIIDSFTAGEYIAVVANHTLSIGEFGPTQVDAALAGSYDYEINGPEPSAGQVVFNCVLSGNLGGGFSKIVKNSDTCSTPPTPVPEPSLVSMTGTALVGVGLLAWYRRRGTA